jgi:hypothetical protein
MTEHPTEKQFLFDVAELSGATGRSGTIVQTEMADRFPTEVGRHPIRRTVAYTYSATLAYVEQCEHDDRLYRDKLAAYDRYRDELGQRRLQAGSEAAAKVRQTMEKRHPRPLAMSGAASGGASMTRSPDVQSRIKAEALEAREEAEAAFDSKNPTLDLATWERKIYKP